MAASSWAARSFLEVLQKTNQHAISPKQPTSFRGKPAVRFSDEDVRRYSEPFAYTLIGKFSNGRPNMEALRKAFQTIGFGGSFSLGLIDHRHILIRFDHQEDYFRCWKRGVWFLEGSLMRIIKWHPDFSVDSESSIVPVWISLPLLPIHLYNKEALYSIGQLIGEPFKIDAATESLSRPSQARICVELDLLKERHGEVFISLGSRSFWQKIEYENLPLYCSNCFKIGHASEACRLEASSRTKGPDAPSKLQATAPRMEYRPVVRQPKDLNSDNPSSSTQLPSVAVDADSAAANTAQHPCASPPDSLIQPPTSEQAVLGPLESSKPSSIPAVPKHMPSTSSLVLPVQSQEIPDPLAVSTLPSSLPISSKIHNNTFPHDLQMPASSARTQPSAPSLTQSFEPPLPPALAAAVLPHAQVPPSTIAGTALTFSVSSTSSLPTSAGTVSSASEPNFILVSSPLKVQNEIIPPTHAEKNVAKLHNSHSFSKDELTDFFKNFSPIPDLLSHTQKKVSTSSSSATKPTSPSPFVPPSTILEEAPLYSDCDEAQYRHSKEMFTQKLKNPQALPSNPPKALEFSMNKTAPPTLALVDKTSADSNSSFIVGEVLDIPPLAILVGPASPNEQGDHDDSFDSEEEFPEFQPPRRGRGKKKDIKAQTSDRNLRPRHKR